MRWSALQTIPLFPGLSSYSWGFCTTDVSITFPFHPFPRYTWQHECTGTRVCGNRTPNEKTFRGEDLFSCMSRCILYPQIFQTHSNLTRIPLFSVCGRRLMSVVLISIYLTASTTSSCCYRGISVAKWVANIKHEIKGQHKTTNFNFAIPASHSGLLCKERNDGATVV